MTSIVGVVNVTTDSFSDGGRYLDPDAAYAHGLALREDGADALDLGAESSNPRGQDVTAAEEMARLVPLVRRFARAGVATWVDTYKPEVMRAVLAEGACGINDVFAFRAPGAIEALAAYPAARLVVMHSRSSLPRAGPPDAPFIDVVAPIRAFFTERLAALAAGGIDAARVALDPGMGFFSSTQNETSLWALRRLADLRVGDRPLYVGVSRKAFLGALTGRGVHERGASTLAAELWVAAQGVEMIRTHDVRALRDGLRVWRAIEGARGPVEGLG